MKNKLVFVTTIVLLLLVNLSIAAQGEIKQSEWAGYVRYDFKYNNRDAILVIPDKAAEGNPWIWRPAFFDAFPAVDKALLEKGFHVAYYDLTHLYGSPRAVKLGTGFYNHMIYIYNLSPQVTLEGFSRGGLFAFNWATANPDKVACIYVDAPVCNLSSWPGLKNKELWKDMLKEWGIKDEDMETFKGSPINYLDVIALHAIPIISVCGDADDVVPYSENMEIVRNRLVEQGSPVQIILKPGVRHHPHSLEDPKPVVDFIVRNQPAYKENQVLNIRGNLYNSYLKFEKERKGRVAFLGGSITEMTGWRDMIEEQLKQRFPYTTFEFVRAGIASTGSTPGSFRFKQDVLRDGKIDLLFVEAAVNDDTNGFNYIGQTRGMEGEIRQALLSNPEMDIIMLHFIYDPFIDLYKEGRLPDVLFNHERVANHYEIPSINLIQEINERMDKGEFTWEEFGGTHPAPLGHTYYAAAINNLLDNMWAFIDLNKKPLPHPIPEKPLDTYSYFNGDFYDIKNAHISSGWEYVAGWNPDNKIEKRRLFVDVPMLEAKKPKAELSLTFEGRAIGIFCVCGPSAGIIEYSIDGGPFRKLDTYTEWSSFLYIPWVYILDDQLTTGTHQLVLKMSEDKNPNSQGHELQIRNFLINK